MCMCVLVWAAGSDHFLSSLSHLLHVFEDLLSRLKENVPVVSPLTAWHSNLHLLRNSRSKAAPVINSRKSCSHQFGFRCGDKSRKWRPPVWGNRSFFTQPWLVVGFPSACCWDICRKEASHSGDVQPGDSSMKPQERRATADLHGPLPWASTVCSQAFTSQPHKPILCGVENTLYTDVLTTDCIQLPHCFQSNVQMTRRNKRSAVCLCALLGGLRGHHVGPDWPGIQVIGVNSSKNTGIRLELAETHQVQNRGCKNQLNRFFLSLSGWERLDPDMRVNEQTHTHNKLKASLGVFSILVCLYWNPGDRE